MKIRPRARKLVPALVALLSLTFLSGPETAGLRKIACVDSTEDLLKASYLPLEMDLLGRVRSEAEEAALKKNALSYYNFLSQNELKFYLDSQAAQMSYLSRNPFLTNFSLLSVGQGLGGGWGSFNFSPAPQFTNLWGLTPGLPHPSSALAGQMNPLPPFTSVPVLNNANPTLAPTLFSPQPLAGAASPLASAPAAGAVTPVTTTPVVPKVIPLSPSATAPAAPLAPVMLTPLPLGGKPLIQIGAPANVTTSTAFGSVR